MGKDVAAEGAITEIATMNLIAPCGAVWFQLVNIHHNGIGLLGGLAELGYVRKLCCCRVACGCGVNRGITAVCALTVTISGAVLAGDFAADVVDGVEINYFSHNFTFLFFRGSIAATLLWLLGFGHYARITPSTVPCICSLKIQKEANTGTFARNRYLG